MINQLRFLLLLLPLLLMCLSHSARAHDTPVALLELREVSPGTFVESWTYSSAVNIGVPTATYPEHCSFEKPRVVCGDLGLVGSLGVEQLGVKYSAAVVRVTPIDQVTYSLTLSATHPVAQLNDGSALTFGQVALTYVPMGIEHILLGVDHLMFVLGLMLLVSGRWMLFKTITAFTVSHSLTLAAATLGWVGVPESAVNACIALSITIVAVEILRLRQGHTGFSARFPWAIAFAFGLLHGFGFSGALTGIGLPMENLPAALLFFNVGVELGQLAFVAVVLALWASHDALQAQAPRWTETTAVYAMGTLATVWFFSRFAQIVEPFFSQSLSG